MCVCVLYQSASEVESSETAGSHSFSSLAIFEAIFLNPIDVPEMRLKRTPFKESRGSLHTCKEKKQTKTNVTRRIQKERKMVMNRPRVEMTQRRLRAASPPSVTHQLGVI